MKNLTIDKLVSLIMEEIGKTDAPDQPMLFNSLDSLMQFFRIDPNQPEADIDEMSKVSKENWEEGETYRIPVNDLLPPKKGPMPKIVSLDPETNEFVENMVIGNLSTTLPGGLEVLKFYNYGGELKLDRNVKSQMFVALPDNQVYLHRIRNEKQGTAWVDPQREVAPPDESEEDMKTRTDKLSRDHEGYAKMYVINPAINSLFERKDVLNRLDTSLIPETWATPKRTERTTNTEQRLSFGGNGTGIKIEYTSVRDFDNIDAALDEMLKVRMDIEDNVERQRNPSTFKPREYSDYIYTMGGTKNL
jgi:hypothetical protein